MIGRATAWGFVASLAAACGGQVRTGEPTPPSATGAAGDSGIQGPASQDMGPTVDLPECKLGFLVADSAGRSCVYVVSGRCYEKKLDACACACKKASGTVCLNGFPEYDGTTKVTCD